MKNKKKKKKRCYLTKKLWAVLRVLQPENCSECHFHRNSQEVCVNMGLKVKGL